MKETKDPRGRKPVKDKKITVRLYIRESELKALGGDKKAIQKFYAFVEREINGIKL